MTYSAITVPSEELGVHFCPHIFCIVVQHEGSWMGLGPFTVWQMVDYPNKHTNYPGFPLCAWALLKAAEGPATRPANSGSAGTRAAHTLALSYFLASSSSLLTFPFFTVNSYSFLSHLARSVHNQILKGFCFNTIPRLYLGGDCSCP